MRSPVLMNGTKVPGQGGRRVTGQHIVEYAAS